MREPFFVDTGASGDPEAVSYAEWLEDGLLAVG